MEININRIHILIKNKYPQNIKIFGSTRKNAEQMRSIHENKFGEESKYLNTPSGVQHEFGKNNVTVPCQRKQCTSLTHPKQHITESIKFHFGARLSHHVRNVVFRRNIDQLKKS